MIRSNRKPTPNPAVEGNGKLLIVQINFEVPIILTNGVFFMWNFYTWMLKIL